MNTNDTIDKISSEKSIAVGLIYAFTICVALFFAVAFTALNLYYENAKLSNTFVLLIGILAMLAVLFFTYKKKYKMAKFLVSTVPPFIVLVLSVIAKLGGFTDTIYLYLAPRMFTIVFLTVPVIFFGLNNLKQLIIACSIILIPAIFFDPIHHYFDIHIEDLSFEKSSYPILVFLISMMYLFIFASILFFQKTGLTFRIRMMRKNEELSFEKKEIEGLNKQLEYQAYLYEILNITSQNKPINILLQEVLDVIITSDTLTTDKKGVIFLTNENGDLEIAALHAATALIKSCSLVKPGQCLCGIVLAENKMKFCNSVGHDHTIKPEGMKPHGHYVIPIQQDEVVLGIINIYIKAGVAKEQSVVAYLEAIASILAKKISTIRNAELILENKNKLDTILTELNNGIRYASYLQKSLLPDQATLNTHFRDCAVLYLPKDKIGGDFYFANGVDELIYFGVGDCTGHGVPGSLLASMSVEAVKNVISKNIGSTPDILLSELRNIAIGRFKTNLDSIYSDSMDAAMCLYNKANGELHYAGGYIHLYIVNSDSELTSYDATKCPVGIYDLEQDFQLHTLKLNPGDTIYISSDGYFDQFGMNAQSKKNKPEKYKRRPFFEFIKKINQYDSQKQVDLLHEEIELWRGDLDQIDDITVMVIKH